MPPNFQTNPFYPSQQLQRCNLMMTQDGGMGHDGGDLIKEQNQNLPLSSSTTVSSGGAGNDVPVVVKDEKSGEMGHCRQQTPTSSYFNLDPMDVTNSFDLNASNWPKSIGDVKIHQRLDAVNMSGKWCSGTVVEVIEGPTYQARLHFDYSPRSKDVWLTGNRWKADTMAPLNSKVKKSSASLYRIVVVNRAMGSGTAAQYQRNGSMQQHNDGHCQSREGSNGRRQKYSSSSSRSLDSVGTNNISNNQSSSAVLIHGTPLLLYCDSRASTRHMWRLVVQRVAPYISDAGLSADASSVADCKDDFSLMQKLPFTVRILPSKQVRVENAGVELKPNSIKRAVSVLYGDTLITIDWLDYYKTYVDPMEDMNRLSFSDKDVNGIKAGIPLYSCLEKFTNEESMEVNEDYGYYCKNCDAKRVVSTKTDLWKVPDILVVHIKRFFHMGQCREKIRSLVVFPLSGLDVTNFVAELSPERKNANLGGLMYDLYGVLNHMGDMMNGHYTAYCRGTPCTSGGVEESDYWGLDRLWLNFDDEFVEEISPDKIVTESAYVLFYRRRRFTPSNIVNNTV